MKRNSNCRDGLDAAGKKINFSKCRTRETISIVFFKKWANPGLFLFLFLSFSHHNFNNTNVKKHRWCACDSNPGPQDGRCRQNTKSYIIKSLFTYLSLCLFCTQVSVLFYFKWANNGLFLVHFCSFQKQILQKKL